MELKEFKWIREPKSFKIDNEKIEIITKCSNDGIYYEQMRVCHLHEGKDKIQFGIYVYSPENSSFKAVFSNMQLLE